MKIKSIGFIVLFFILTGCEDNGKTIRAETLSTLSFILKDSCRDYVSKEAESRGLEVSYKEIHNPHPLYRKINLSGVLTYKYYNEATDFIDHINEKCFGSSFSLIEKDVVGRTPINTIINSNNNFEGVLYKNGELRIYFNEN